MKTNIYRNSFSAKCPNNDESIWYELEIKTSDFIMVERISAATKGISGYHENIADQLHDQLGGEQTLTAHHHGVDVVTVRT